MEPWGACAAAPRRLGVRSAVPFAAMGTSRRAAMAAFFFGACTSSACRPSVRPASAHAVTGRPPPLDLARADALVAPLLDGAWIDGASAAFVTRDGAWFRGWGHARTATDTPDADTLYEIGSVTKVFTSLLLAEAVRRGDLALDQPVQSLLPADATVPSRDGRAITLGDLATQTSGLPRMPPSFHPADPANPYADFGAAQLFANLAATTLPRRPGEAYGYSNFGVGLLGFALAAHAHTTYPALVRARITEPLGLRDTVVTLTDDQRARFATGHDADAQPAAPWTLDALAGAGALRSTARDLATVLGLALVPSRHALGAELRSMAVRRADADHGGGIGLGLHVDGAGAVWWHNGETGGYHALMAFDPAAGLGVAVLSNTASGLVDALGFALLRVLRGEAPTALSLPATAHLDAAALDRCVGAYTLAPGAVLTVLRDGDHLTAQLTGQPAFRIWPSSPTEFRYRVVPAQLSFAADGAHAASVVLHQNGRDLPAPRTGP